MTIFQVMKVLGPIDARNIRRDSMLLWMALMPFFFVFLFRYLVPWVRQGLLTQFDFDLQTYYVLLMSYAFVIGTPMLFGMVIGFLLLDERDDGVLMALQVTPVPLNNYLLYRVAVPIFLSVTLTTLTFPLAGLVTFPSPYLFFVALVSAPLGPVFALFFVNFAKNKVQGFALMKGIGSLLALPLLAYFVNMPWQLFFGLIPTYWPLKLYWVLDAGEPGAWLYCLIGMVYSMVLLMVLARRFDTILHQ